MAAGERGRPPKQRKKYPKRTVDHRAAWIKRDKEKLKETLRRALSPEHMLTFSERRVIHYVIEWLLGTRTSADLAALGIPTNKRKILAQHPLVYEIYVKRRDRLVAEKLEKLKGTTILQRMREHEQGASS